MKRRRLLGASAALAGLAPMRAVLAQTRAARKGSALRVGADPAIEACAAALLRGFGAYSGLAAQLEVAPSAAVLESIDRGELDAALTLAPELELQLLKEGLLHDRRALARVDLLLVGPTEGGARGRDAVEALRRIAGNGWRFVGRSDGSGLHLAEQALWRAAGIEPKPPWYMPADASPLAQARAYRAHVLIERAAWSAAAARDKFGVVVDADTRLQAPLHVGRSFRASHSAGKLFVTWVAGPQARKLLARQPGVRLLPAAGRK